MFWNLLEATELVDGQEYTETAKKHKSVADP